jgi:hypothetical protein
VQGKMRKRLSQEGKRRDKKAVRRAEERKY